MSNHTVLQGDRLQRVATLLPALAMLFLIAACGSSSNGGTAPTSNVKNRAFISNAFSGTLQIVDTQNDTTALTAQTTNSAGQLVPGVPVTITVASSATFEVLSPNDSETLVYDPGTNTLYIVSNSTEAVTTDFPLAGNTGMALFSPDSTKVYVPVPNATVAGHPAGMVQVWDVASSTNTQNLTVPNARYVALSPTGQYLLVFSGNSDSITMIDTTASTVTYVNIPGFARPINAFFSSDGNTAYVLNCGPECGSAGAASVMQLNLGSQTIQATVPVGGASVGLLNGTTLYVAGSPVPPGTTSTYDAVDVSNMTRLTANSVAIGDGFHTTMALSNNNKLYIGANTCSNTVTGCLSVVNVASNVADSPLPPRGAVTGLLAIKNRNVMYAIEGGFLDIYDTTTDTLQPTQLSFTGALFGIVQVDQ
jgi:DNA-binding beta-propeller fold protein YncE